MTLGLKSAVEYYLPVCMMPSCQNYNKLGTLISFFLNDHQLLKTGFKQMFLVLTCLQKNILLYNADSFMQYVSYVKHSVNTDLDF